MNIFYLLVYVSSNLHFIIFLYHLANSPNHVTANDQIISKESLFKVTCNTTGFTSAVNYDLFRISNRTAFNVTSKRSEHSLSAEVTSLVDKNTIEWYCCCPGNCADLSKNLGSIPVIVGGKLVVVNILLTRWLFIKNGLLSQLHGENWNKKIITLKIVFLPLEKYVGIEMLNVLPFPGQPILL